MNRRKGIVIGSAVLVMGMCSVLGYHIFEFRSSETYFRRQTATQFEMRYADFYAKYPPVPLATPLTAKKDLPSKGKYILFKSLAKECDAIWFELPEKLKATTPDDVKTVVWVSGFTSSGKTVSGDGYGTQNFVILDVVDCDSNQLLSRRMIKSPPPTLTFELSPPTGPIVMPVAEVVEFLTELAR